MACGPKRKPCPGRILKDPCSVGSDKKRIKYMERRLALIQLLGGKCIDCGYNGHPSALHFDHVRGTKIFPVSTLLVGATWAKVMEEVDKCELVCANCHGIRTFTRLQVQRG